MDLLLDINGLKVDICEADRRTRILDGLDLQLYQGETVALLGASGAGKTTLAHLIMGIAPRGMYKVVAGRMTFYLDGVSWDLLDPRSRVLAGKSIAAIYQEPGSALNPVLTIGRQLHQLCDDDHKDEMASLLLELDLDPEAILQRYPWQLSGGQQQRILLAMALWPQPRLLLADEPTAALDKHRQQRFLELLSQVKSQRPSLSTLFITHDRSLARRIADKVIHLQAGRVVEVSNAKPRSSEGSVSAIGKAAPSAARTLISVRDLQAGYIPGIPVLQGISFDLHAGQLIGIAGPSGSGKSSLLRALLGLMPWQEGHLTLGQEPVRGKEMRNACQLIYQDPGRSFNPRMTMGQAFEEVLRVHKHTPRDAAGHWLEALKLPVDSPTRYPHMFSGGQKQRLAIVRALLASPRVLLCDEPFSALDEPLQAGFMCLLRDLAETQGLGMLIVAHDLPRLRDGCDDLLIIKEGKAYWHGKAADLNAEHDPYLLFLNGNN
jgi:peptide/nickel transport system ATP-binding protein